MLTECKDCKQKFGIMPDLVVHKKEYKIEGQSIFLTYYDCPSCGSRHFVQIDDEVSLKALSATKSQFVNLAMAKKKGKGISKKQSARFKKAREDLSNYRMNLMRQYSNKVVFDVEKNATFELRFLV